MTDEYTVQETAAYHARAVQRIQDGAHANGWKLTLPNVIALESVQAFLDRISRDDLGVFAPQPAAEGKRLLVAVNPDTGIWEDDRGDKWVRHQKLPVFDPEPQPEDGPEYHAEHAAWDGRHRGHN